MSVGAVQGDVGRALACFLWEIDSKAALYDGGTLALPQKSRQVASRLRIASAFGRPPAGGGGSLCAAIATIGVDAR